MEEETNTLNSIACRTQVHSKAKLSCKTENNVNMNLRHHLDAHVGGTGQSLLSHLLNGSHSEAIGAATNPERLDKLTLHACEKEGDKTS